MSADPMARDAATAGRSVAASLAQTALGVGVLALVMTAAITWRVSHRPDMPAALAILAWQVIVWLPWLAYFYAIKYLTRRIGPIWDAAAVNISLHSVAALLVAGSHLIWYWQVSSLASPFRGLPGTKFGAYAFFFVFWFLIDLLLYWTIVLGQEAGASSRAPAREAPDGESTHSNDFTKQFTVRKGRARHLVRVDDIRWVEAQGYYAALHTRSDSFLIRRSLMRLEEELDPDRFIRVHRSTIVNIDHVSGMEPSREGVPTVILADGGRRRMSRTGQRRLKSLLRHLS